MKGLMRVLVALTLFIAGACAAAYASGNSPASLLQTTGTTTTGTTTGTTGTTTGTTTVTTGTTVTTTTGTTTTTPTARKVTVCHHTRSKKNPHRTITVSRSALAAHMRHGDTVGPCTTASTIRKHSTSTHVRKFHKNQTLRSEIKRETKRKP